MQSGDSEEIRTTAHSLKSSSGNIRAKRLAALLQELESLGKEGDAQGAAALFPTVRSEYEAVMDFLSEHGDRRGSLYRPSRSYTWTERIRRPFMLEEVSICKRPDSESNE